MKSLPWDYSSLAESYHGRPPYADAVIDDLMAIAGVAPGDRVCDIGAGTGHLSVHLVAHGLVVDAVEPNDAMRGVGRERLADAPVEWFEARGEDTGRPEGAYPLVTFGSSFNVVEHARALAEVARILDRPGWVAMMWNHRELDADEWVEAWNSHATLARQAGDQMEQIVDEIAARVAHAQDGGRLTVPYTTRCWVAEVKGP